MPKKLFSQKMLKTKYFFFCPIQLYSEMYCYAKNLKNSNKKIILWPQKNILVTFCLGNIEYTTQLKKKNKI